MRRDSQEWSIKVRDEVAVVCRGNGSEYCRVSAEPFTDELIAYLEERQATTGWPETIDLERLMRWYAVVLRYVYGGTVSIVIDEAHTTLDKARDQALLTAWAVLLHQQGERELSYRHRPVTSIKCPCDQRRR